MICAIAKHFLMEERGRHGMEGWRILCDQAVNQVSGFDYRIISILCLDFTLDSSSQEVMMILTVFS